MLGRVVWPVPGRRRPCEFCSSTAQEAIRKQIADGLAGWSRNHRVFWVSQPDLAAVRAEGLHPHIVLLDDATGDTDFEQLIQQLGDSVPGVAILVLIAPDAVDAASRAVLAGAQAFLTKPINADELLLTLSQLDAADLNRPPR